MIAAYYGRSATGWIPEQDAQRTGESGENLEFEYRDLDGRTWKNQLTLVILVISCIFIYFLLT